MKTKTMVLCAVFAAILCVFSVISIPIGPVPVSLGVLGVMLAAVILGPKRGALSVLVFILLGCIGLPVFTGFRGGFQVLAGVTGGYIWAYIPMAVIIGLFTLNPPENKWLAMLKIFAGCIVGIVILYALGTIQFMLVKQADLKTALTLCVIPFIPFELGKSVVAVYGGFHVSKALKAAGFLA